MRTLDEIFDALCAEFAAHSGVMPVPGGDMALRLKAVAAEMFSLEAQAEFTLRQSFPQTAVAEYLDRHAQVRGLKRGKAKKAVGKLRFYVMEAAGTEIEIPVGTECMTKAGIAFRTVERGVISPGETDCEVRAEAVQGGGSGNASHNTIVYIKLFPDGIAGVVNDERFSGGCDDEDDETLRARILASYRTLPNGANKAYYESKVLAVPGVKSVVVQPKKRGIGTVDIVFATTAGAPTEEEIAAVKATLDEQREICVDIAVEAPDITEVNITASILCKNGFDADTVHADVEQAIRGYFGGKLLGKAVYRAALYSLIMGVTGVENCYIQNPAGDLEAEETVLPCLGELHIEEAV